ncbi:MFS family permease [Runella defluvii]|uniref:MFS family permease n=1 Tax=Runella defluvii TaxID=370973 RepID=A0A7W6ER12_9BACT|nr:MFS transporter [Runella defluvii]MBB3839160.1 MFS family permease [Runella defluvii]
MTKSSRYPWILVGLLWVVALLNYMDRQMLATMRPSMQIDIAELQQATNFGRLMAVFLWVYAFMSPVAGMIGDRLNRKWLIVGSLFVWSGVTFAMGYATSFSQLYVLRALMGISEALYMPTGLAMIADFHSSRTRSMAIGVHLSGNYMGQALGGFGATIADKFSWNTAFQAFGMIGMAYAVVLIVFLREKNKSELIEETASLKNQDKVPLLKGLGVLLGNPAFWLILLLFSVPSLPGWAVKNWLPTLFADKLHIEMGQAGPLSTITTSLSSLIGVIIGGYLSDRWVQKHLRGRIYTSIIGLVLTIPALLLIAYGTTITHAIAAGMCFGLGFGMFDGNNMPILCQFVSAKYRATGYGFMNMMGIMAGALITEWLGKSTDSGGLAGDFALLAGVVLAIVVVQLLFLRPKVRDFVD